MVFSAASLFRFNYVQDNVLIHVILRLVWLNYHYDHRLCFGIRPICPGYMYGVKRVILLILYPNHQGRDIRSQG